MSAEAQIPKGMGIRLSDILGLDMFVQSSNLQPQTCEEKQPNLFLDPVPWRLRLNYFLHFKIGNLITYLRKQYHKLKKNYA
jgi:hypothetical protein